MKLKLLFLSGTLGFLIVIFVYNFIIEVDIFRYIITSLLIFSLYLLLFTKYKKSNLFLFLATIAIPLLIDASVLITSPRLIPLRFPFASIFPIIGAGAGYLYTRKKNIQFGILIFLSCIFFYFAYKIFIPKIIYYQFTQDKNKVPNSFFASTFYTIDNKPIKLIDTANAKSNLIECFFIGCGACEEKVPELLKLKNTFTSNNLKITFICNGSITNFDDFLFYAKTNSRNGLTYLYDRDSILSKKFKIKGYPFEILAKQDSIQSILLGFDRAINSVYFNNEIKKINTILHE